MQISIENIPENTKKLTTLLFSKIKNKSIPWNESKGTSYTEARADV